MESEAVACRDWVDLGKPTSRAALIGVPCALRELIYLAWCKCS